MSQKCHNRTHHRSTPLFNHLVGDGE